MGLTWARDDGYEVVECSMLEWHNAAAEIAMELSPERPQVIWRDYQYQASCNLKKLYKYTFEGNFVTNSRFEISASLQCHPRASEETRC